MYMRSTDSEYVYVCSIHTCVRRARARVCVRAQHTFSAVGVCMRVHVCVRAQHAYSAVGVCMRVRVYLACAYAIQVWLRERA